MPLKSRFFKHVFTLFTGSASAQVVTFLFYLLLARVYMPEHFGFIAIYTATVMIIGEIANGRYDLSILLPAEDDDALNLLRLSLLIAFMVTGITVLLLVPLYFSLQHFNVEGVLLNYFWFLPLSVLIHGILQPASFFLNRTQRYKAISWYRFSQAITTGCVSLLFGILGWLEYGLLAGFVTGQIVALLLMLLFLMKNFSQIFIRYPFEQIKLQAKKFREFPRYSITSSLFNSVGRQSPFYLLAVFFGTEVTGHFSLAYKLITSPVMLISGAYSQVFYERAVKLHNKMNSLFNHFILRNVRNLSLAAVLPALIAFVWGQEIVVLLLGEKWMEAGKYLEYLTPFAYISFVIIPLLYVINIKKKLRVELFYNVLLMTSRAVWLVAGGLFFTASIAIAGFSALSVVFNLSLLLYIMKISRKNNGKSMRP